MLPSGLKYGIEQALRNALGENVVVESYSPASGGCINNGGELKTNAKSFFVKWNDATKYPGMFEAEAKGLHLLASTVEISIPDVHAVGSAEGFQFIVLSNIQTAPRNSTYWQHLGERLAAIHTTSSLHFGLDHDNFIGSLRQDNSWRSTWIEFFIKHRLDAQLKLAEANQEATAVDRNTFENLYVKLPSLLTEERPALDHGDLWSGNIMSNEKGDPCLIDPAVYFGHRETDIAMTRLFGGFPHDFYAAYQSNFPMPGDYAERLEIYSLYPLLVHVNLFGGGYMQQVRAIVKKFL